MTDFYPRIDRLCWPVSIGADNDTVRVIEDPDGVANVIEIELTHSSQLANSAVYYAIGVEDPDDGANSGTKKVIDGSGETHHVRPLYSEIASDLTAESASVGSGLTYRFQAIQPTGSDFDNTGLQLSTQGGTVTIDLQFTPSDALDPRFFGFSKDGETFANNPPSAGTAIQGPFSRWGTWFSPVRASRKTHVNRRRAFKSAPHPRFSKRWIWTKTALLRTFEYIGVPGAHVYREDRADRVEPADRAGLTQGDANNALEDLWEFSGFDDDQILLGHHQGDQGLGSILTFADGSVSTTDTFEMGKLQTDFLQAFDPQSMTDRDHQGEKYDLTFTLAVNDPDNAVDEGYRH